MLAARTPRRLLLFWLPVGVVAAVTVDIIILSTGGGAGLIGLNPGGTGPGWTPLGTALDLASPTETTVIGHHWYNFSVIAAGSGLTAGALGFAIVLGNSTVTSPPGAAWTLTLVAPNGTALGMYSWSTTDWVSGGASLVSPAQTFALDSLTTNLSPQGVLLEVVGHVPFTGTVLVSIP